MAEEITTLIGAAVILFFLQRFIRTHMLYRYSLRVLRGLEEPTQAKPSLSREFFDQAILGNRSVEPNSFFIRALVFVTIALILLPFKDYAPDIYWIVVILIALYVPWCVGHGLLLRKEKDNCQKSPEVQGIHHNP
jgi:hypothetical protein